MVQCIIKIRNLINGIPTTQTTSSKDQADVLKSVLEGIVDDDSGSENCEIEKKLSLSNNKRVVSKETLKTEVSTKAIKNTDIKKPSDCNKTDIKKPCDDNKADVKKPSPSDAKNKKTDVTKSSDAEALKVKKPEILIKKQSGHTKKFGLLLTGLSEDQKLTIQTNLQQLSKISGGKSSFKVVKDYSPDTVSHIICACAAKSHCPRTLKYLLGIAGKSWIISFDWILESLAANKILDEHDFIVVGDEAVQCDTNACERSRADPGKLFDAKRFFLAGLFNAPGPSKADLINLIQFAGGTVCKKQEEGVLVVSNNANGPKDGELPYTWLFDAISLYKI